MLESKKGGVGLTRCSNERKRTRSSVSSLTKCSNESKRTRSLVSGDLNWYTNEGDVWSRLGEEGSSKLSKSVVSLALSDGNTVLFSFSGIAIERKRKATRFLTSASLVRALNNNKSKNHDFLKIEVRHEGKVVTGFLKEYDLDLEIAIVKVKSSLDVDAVSLYHRYEYMPYCDVVSLGRDISGKLMAKTGKLTHDSSGSKEYLMFSSCKLSEVWEGGPLFDSAGGFVGMNLVPSMAKSFFLPVNLIVERLQHFKTSQERTAFLARVKDLKPSRVGERPTDDKPYSQSEGAPSKDHHGYLDALGYPKPTDSGMILVYSFEEHFGDVYCGGFWDKLTRRVHQKIHQSVVSLASFNGDKRFFACSGIFIDWDGKCQDNEYQTILTSACLVRNSVYPYGDKIVEGLRIEVLLPGNKRREGTLIHYSLHYNVALVRVKESDAVSHAICKHGWVKWEPKSVAAVGRCFKSGDLMASSGKLVRWSGPLHYPKLDYSTCRITKAGIGGPLVDDDGNFIGMNFYDPILGTPFLFCDHIVDILDYFKKGTGAEIKSFRIDGNDSFGLNKWPVPPPYWRHPGDPDDIIDSNKKIYWAKIIKNDMNQWSLPPRAQAAEGRSKLGCAWSSQSLKGCCCSCSRMSPTSVDFFFVLSV